MGRFLPQVVFAFSAYAQLLRRGALKAGDAFDLTVPTGNFGNIFAALVARSMGVPVRRLICASNDNHVLTDFLATGQYDLRQVSCDRREGRERMCTSESGRKSIITRLV